MLLLFGTFFSQFLVNFSEFFVNFQAFFSPMFSQFSVIFQSMFIQQFWNYSILYDFLYIPEIPSKSNRSKILRTITQIEILILHKKLSWIYLNKRRGGEIKEKSVSSVWVNENCLRRRPVPSAHPISTPKTILNLDTNF